MGATILGLYNAALFEVGDRQLSATTENVEARRVLDSVYDRVLAICLSEGQWNFATRSVKLAADTGIAPNFGMTEIFAKPTDWVRTTAFCSDDHYLNPILNYNDELGFWATDTSPVYVRYVSNHASYGNDLTIWPEAYTRYVELALAHRILPRLSQNKSDKERIMRDLKLAKRNAMSQDAMNDAQPRFLPSGRFTLSRGSKTRGDRGNRGSFTG